MSNLKPYYFQFPKGYDPKEFEALLANTLEQEGLSLTTSKKGNVPILTIQSPDLSDRVSKEMDSSSREQTAKPKGIKISISDLGSRIHEAMNE